MSRQYVQIVLLTVSDPSVFEDYLSRLAPIVARYGGGLEVAIRPESTFGADPPQVVNVVHYESRAAFHAFGADPGFQAIVGLRASSSSMITVGGVPDAPRGPAAPVGALYLVEIAQYGPRGEAAYLAYQADAERAMGPFGYRVERSFTPDSASGLPFAADRVTVARFDTVDGYRAFHGDPAHAPLEAAYPAAVARSVWVIGPPVRTGP